MEKTPKNDSSVLTLLTTVLKKSIDTTDLAELAESVKQITSEITHLAGALALITSTLQKHNEAIDELYAVQEVILQRLKSPETRAPNLTSNKKQKPN